VTGLTNGTAYVFRVSAKNAARTGVPSAASSSVTPRPETGPPEVEVFVNSMPFAIGSSTTFLTGRNILSAGNVSVSVTLVNSGRGDLVISDWNLNQDFIATSPFPDRISPNGSVTVSILPSASPFGRRSGALTFKTNDSDEPSFNITLRGMVFESVSSAPGEAIRVPDGVVTLYESDPRFTVSIEPANGPMDFDGAYVIRRFDSQGRLVSRQTYNGLMSEVVIYGSVNVENWTSFTTRPIRVRFR